MMVPAPARRAAAADREPLLPPAPRMATTGPAAGAPPGPAAPRGHFPMRHRPPAGPPGTGQPGTGAFGAHHPLGEGRRAAHVQDREREGGRQVRRQHRGDRPAEQDRVPGAGDLLGLAVPAGQPVGHGQRGQAEGDQRRDPVTGRQPERRRGSRLVHHAGEHPAGPGHRVLHLAAPGDDVEHRAPHGPDRSAGRFPQLAVGGGIQVQPVYRNADFIRPDRRVCVQPPGRLRQYPGRLEHPVQAEW